MRKSSRKIRSKLVFLLDVDNTLLDNDRVPTVFPQQGHYAADAKILAKYPAPDISIPRIGDLLAYGRTHLLNPGAGS